MFEFSNFYKSLSGLRTLEKRKMRRYNKNVKILVLDYSLKLED